MELVGVMDASSTIAIAIPCYNEALTIAKVVQDFKRALPQARVYVLDNASQDNSAALAARAGAFVIPVASRGKGHVVRAIFESIEADVVVMVDGDDTYPAHAVHDLIDPVLTAGIDMVVGTRLKHFERSAGDGRLGSFRPLHEMGNKCIVFMLNFCFGTRLNDVLSGYRAFSPRFMVSMPVLSEGFEIETELTVHAILQGYTIRELSIPYGVRPEGSYSKLSTWRDGVRIVRCISLLFKDAFPLRFFSCVAIILALMAAIWGNAVWHEFEQYGRVQGLARAVAVVGMGILAALLWGVGLVLDVSNHRAREAHRLHVQSALRQRAWLRSEGHL